MFAAYSRFLENPIDLIILKIEGAKLEKRVMSLFKFELMFIIVYLAK